MEIITKNQHDNILTLTLNRPEHYNAINIDVAISLYQTLIEAANDDQVKVIIITGAGNAFSAGGDIKRAMSIPEKAHHVFYELATHVHNAFTMIARIPKPVIAAINGVAAGGGFSLSLICDFRIMSSAARLKLAFTSNGLSVDGGASYTLPRLVGTAKALEIATFDESIDAEQAYKLGLVTKICAADKLQETTLAMASLLKSKALHSFAYSKQLFAQSFQNSLENQFNSERDALISCVQNPQGQEGLNAFLEKRPAKYNQK